MEMEFPSRPRLIDRLRLFEVFRRHIGEADAKEAVDALQDEFAPMATHDDIRNLMVWIEARLNALAIRLLLGMTAIAGTIAGIALAIAKLT